MLKLTSNILEEIKNGQKEDFELVDRVVLVNQGKGGDRTTSGLWKEPV